MGEADRQLASGLARMPTELLSKVSDELSTSELCSLRLTCRLVDHKLFNDFAINFFRKKQFMVTSRSLQALTDIANSRFGGYLRHVIIGIDQLGSNHWNEAVTAEDKRFFREAADDQKFLGRVGCALELKTALENLVNLETVDIRDFNSQRHRDGRHAKWTSYGATRLRRYGHVSRGNAEWAASVFQNVLLGAAAAGVHLKSLEVIFKEGGRLHDSSLYLPKPIGPDMSALLSGLTTLHLDLTVGQDELRHCGFPNLCEIILQSHNVSWLRLNCSMAETASDDTGDPGWSGFIDWLAKKAPSASDIVARYDTPPALQLQKLDFGRAYMRATQLLEVVKAYPTLTSLSLQRVKLTEPPAVNPITATASNVRSPMTPRVFTELLKGLDDTSLRTLSVKFATQYIPLEGWGSIRWKKGGAGSSEGITLRSQPGRLSFKDAVNLVSISTTSPSYYPSADGDSESEGDDNDDADAADDSEEENEGSENDSTDDEGD